MNLFEKIKEKFSCKIRPYDPIYLMAERSISLQALTLVNKNKGLTKINDFSLVEFCAFSQWGEDGIINWLIDKLPGIPNTFIEFGVGDYRESNTRLLLNLRNWQGLVMDGSLKNIQDIHNQEIYWRYSLDAKHAFIDRDNINDLINESKIKGEIGLLSIDVDGNDFWIWESLNVISPAIVVCEYNAVLGDIESLTVPYDSKFYRTDSHYSNLFFGASIRALIKLGKEKGYKFVGTTSTGCNAFFVRNDLVSSLEGSLETTVAYPSSVREARDSSGSLLFTAGVERSHAISNLPLMDLDKGHLTTLANFSKIYSQEWTSGMKVLI